MNATSAYAQQATMTATPAQLVLMLYDGALARIERAAEALQAQPPDLTVANTAIGRAQRIVLELTSCLDRERGGDLAVNLAAIYAYCERLLVDANVRKDAAPLQEAATLLGQLRDAWDEACVGTLVAAP